MANAEFIWNGQNVIDEVHMKIRHNMLAMAHDVVVRASVMAPKRSGELSRSIGFDWNDENFTVVFTVGASYGIFQEYGTRNMPPHPYLRPAIEQVGPQYGFNIEMAFLNTPDYNQPVLAVGSKFAVPSTLSNRQKAQVRANEKASKHFYRKRGNVAHAKMHAHRRHF